MNEHECFPLDPLANHDLDEHMSLADFTSLVSRYKQAVYESLALEVIELAPRPDN
jgi:hypothetical protein